MKEFLQQSVFDNKVWDILLLVGVILVLTLLRNYLSKYFAQLIFKVFHKSFWRSGREMFVHLLKGPIHLFLLSLVVFLMLDNFNYPSVLRITIHHVALRDILEAVGRAILILTLTWLMLRVIDFTAMILEQRTDHTHGVSGTQLVVFFKDLLKVIVIFLGLLLLIRFTLNRDITSLLAGFGIVGAAVALSARESLENLIASFIIFFDKPFSTGDLVKIQNIIGSVERIGLRSTRIRTDQKTYVTVPNKQMVDSILDNWSLRSQRKGLTLLELAADTPMSKVDSLINAARNAFTEMTEIEGTPGVYLLDISRNSLVVQVEYFTGPIAIEMFNALKQRINLMLLSYLEEYEIKLAVREGVA
jgi:MscS family membrane protein